MAIALYWRERLKARQPLYLEALRMEGYNFIRNPDALEDSWYKAVAKQAWATDYRAWFDEIYLAPFKSNGYYQDFPDRLPVCGTDLEFFTAIGPFLHVIGKAQQTRSYKVHEFRPYEGRQVKIKVSRNFVRLARWEDHVAAYELLTGSRLGSALASGETVDAVQMLSEGARAAADRLAANKEAIDRAMGKGGDLTEDA